MIYGDSRYTSGIFSLLFPPVSFFSSPPAVFHWPSLATFFLLPFVLFCFVLFCFVLPELSHSFVTHQLLLCHGMTSKCRFILARMESMLPTSNQHPGNSIFPQRHFFLLITFIWNVWGGNKTKDFLPVSGVAVLLVNWTNMFWFHWLKLMC